MHGSLTIRFPASRSARLEQALEIARQEGQLESNGEGYTAVFADAGRALPFFELVRNWKGVEIEADGGPVDANAVFQFAWCFKNREAQYRPPAYCHGLEGAEVRYLNLFGCIRGEMEFGPYATWATWGRFADERGTWLFDHERIAHHLRSKLWTFRFCPALDLDLAEAFLAALPRSINPLDDHDWCFVRGYEASPGSLPMRKLTGEDAHAIGAAPRGIDAARAILERMGHALPPAFALVE